MRVKVDVGPDTAIAVLRYVPVEIMLAREGRVAVCIRALGPFSIRVVWRKAMFWCGAVAERLAWELHSHLTNRPQSGARLTLKGFRRLVTVLDFYAGVRTGGMGKVLDEEIWRRGVDTVFGQFWRMVEG